ncbi:hypothetical protein [Streptomyces sp. cg35]|uniref:hypothetical protein n=1 Tax=Streptomyces sp. cg35 TaxID=3421650 RepID=UPI003D167912
MGLPIVTDPCLNPALGVGTDNELDMRIGDDPRPPTFPTERGVYLDTDLGLWADPAPTYTHKTATGSVSEYLLEAKKTVNFAATVLDIDPSPVHTVLVSGVLWARVYGERQDATADGVGNLKPRLAVTAGDETIAGHLDNILASGSGIAPVWGASVQVPFRVVLPPAVRKPLSGALRVQSSMNASWKLTFTFRLLTATAVTIRPEGS